MYTTKFEIKYIYVYVVDILESAEFCTSGVKYKRANT